MATARISRRNLLVSILLGSSSLLATQGIALTVPQRVPWLPGQSPTPRAFDGARFFTAAERRCVDAITARLIPTDETGPGAREAGVADFIDNQLAGFYGRGYRWYMKGPFADGTDEQGFQSQHAPAQLYRTAIEALDRFCRERFTNRTFADLDEDDQDDVLRRLQKGEIKFDGVSAKTFFKLVRENTIEGFFCDPSYGGNRDMVGWRLVGFPGVRYDYRDFLDHNGAAISIEPVGLRGRPAWNVD